MTEIKQIRCHADLMRWRVEVIEHVFGVIPDKDLLEANSLYYKNHIADESHRAYVALTDGEEAGCGAICFTDELPSPDNRSGRCAYLMNIYVREAFRNRGIAHQIVGHLIKVALSLDCGKIYLETTEEGRPVYASLGFRDLPDMMKYYEKDI